MVQPRNGPNKGRDPFGQFEPSVQAYFRLELLRYRAEVMLVFATLNALNTDVPCRLCNIPVAALSSSTLIWQFLGILCSPRQETNT